MPDKDYDVVIAGAGIAGLTAGLLSARAGRRTRVLTGPALGGQLLNIERIDGYPGFPDGIAGYDLCPMVQEQAVAASAEFAATLATSLSPREGRWTVAAANDLSVPIHVLASALFERFTSRGEADYGNRLLSALRKQFGGHAEKPHA